MNTVALVIADYHNAEHAKAIVELLDLYARDEMGGDKPLSAQVKRDLVATMASYAQAFTVLAFLRDQPVGLINCFQTLSTFTCKPLINIHDVTVNAEARGLGVAAKMLDKVEQVARDRGCCKLTLEVLEGNKVAQSVYRRHGFNGYELKEEYGNALFWEKKLAS